MSLYIYGLYHVLVFIAVKLRNFDPSILLPIMAVGLTTIEEVRDRRVTAVGESDGEWSFTNRQVLVHRVGHYGEGVCVVGDSYSDSINLLHNLS